MNKISKLCQETATERRLNGKPRTADAFDIAGIEINRQTDVIDHLDVEIERLTAEVSELRGALKEILALDYRYAGINCCAYTAYKIAETALSGSLPQLDSADEIKNADDGDPMTIQKPCDTCRDQVLPDSFHPSNQLFCRDCYREITYDKQNPCQHPVHSNPGLIVPCPECGADDSKQEQDDFRRDYPLMAGRIDASLAKKKNADDSSQDQPRTMCNEHGWLGDGPCKYCTGEWDADEKGGT